MTVWELAAWKSCGAEDLRERLPSPSGQQHWLMFPQGTGNFKAVTANEHWGCTHAQIIICGDAVLQSQKREAVDIRHCP